MNFVGVFGDVGLRHGQLFGLLVFDLFFFLFFRGFGCGLKIFEFFLVKFCAADHRGGFGVCRGLFVLGLDEFRSQSSSLILAEVGVDMDIFLIGEVGNGRGRRIDARWFMARRIGAVSGERGILSVTDIFVGGNGSGLRFRGRVG
jgi:hypothetical protein